MYNSISQLLDSASLNEVKLGKKQNRSENTGLLFDNNRSGGINGEIDEPVYQGEYGDCWLLSGILSMSYTDSGAQALKDGINLNSDGSVDISFSGANREYNISAEELERYNMSDMDENSLYSTGDDDMLAVELGIEAIVSDETVDTKYSIQDGGNPYYVFKLFDADNIKVASSKEKIITSFDYFEENQDKCSMTLGVVDKSVCGLKANHGYAVKSIDKDDVILVDPWDSASEISVSKKELIQHYENLSIVYADFEE